MKRSCSPVSHNLANPSVCSGCGVSDYLMKATVIAHTQKAASPPRATTSESIIAPLKKAATPAPAIQTKTTGQFIGSRSFFGGASNCILILLRGFSDVVFVV